jgi:hypothetical protein
MSRRCPLLVSYWIKGANDRGPLGFGVTAWSIGDAFALLEERGFKIDLEKALVRPNVQPHEVGHSFVAMNSGPAYFRGVWFPCLNIGWGASGQR